MKKLKRFITGESGQVLVLAALLMTVLIGVAALAVDVGLVAATKSKLQNDADAAALAGAMKISSGKSAAEETAVRYAKENDDKLEDSKMLSEANFNMGTVYVKADTVKKTIEVVCTRKLSYSFAKILGFADTTVSARAVAQKMGFDGGVLPFMNFDRYTKGGEVVIWDNEGKGNKERLNTRTAVYEFDPLVGAVHGNGKMSNIKGEVEDICKDGAQVYLLSLSNDEMFNGNNIPVTEKNGKSGSFRWPGGNVGQESIIDSCYLVLLKCTVKYYNNGTASLIIDEVYEDLTPSGISNIKTYASLVE
ncbi:MAG: pilus assembly protein TadG-related protein [Sedimentibacter sp.]|uniref:pilus assembly protein TadG-related protein n=1 Tax=Sedimentibacter sp. TaxID=1960295 RepID=UPI003158BFBC